MNLSGFVIARQAALNANVSTDRANQLGLMGGLIKNTIMSAVLVQTVAKNEAQPATTVTASSPILVVSPTTPAPGGSTGSGTPPPPAPGANPDAAALADLKARLDRLQTQVPDLLGKKLEEAIKLASEKGLIAAKTTDDPEKPLGIVTGQNPEALSLVARGVTVHLTVGSRVR